MSKMWTPIALGPGMRHNTVMWDTPIEEHSNLGHDFYYHLEDGSPVLDQE